jgi:hypothetical protein
MFWVAFMLSILAARFIPERSYAKDNRSLKEIFEGLNEAFERLGKAFSNEK